MQRTKLREELARRWRRAYAHRCWMFSAVLLTTVIALVTTECQWIGPTRQAAIGGDTLWSQTPASEEGAQIVERWTVAWDNEGLPRLSEEEWKGLRGSVLTLAVIGPSSSATVPNKEAADTIVQAFEKSALDLQNQGVVVRGLHLDFRDSESSPQTFNAAEETQKGLGDLFRRVRRQLGRELELSAALTGLTQEALQAEVAIMAPNLDWVLIDLYGQGYDAIDEPKLWDLEAAMNRLRVVRAAGVPSRGLVRLEGSVSLLAGETSTPLTKHLPCDLLIELAAKSDSVFKFEGYFRQVFQAHSRRDVIRLGDTEIETGARLRVSRVTPEHLRRLRNSAEQLDDPQFLGFVFRGVTEDLENCLGVDRNALARSSRPPEKHPRVTLDALANNRFRVILEGGAEPTALGRKLYNFVDLEAGDSGLIDNVELDGFVQYVFLSPGGEPMPGFAGKGVRFYLPLLTPGQVVTATVHARAVGQLKATPVFRSSTGEPLATEPVVWPAPGEDR